MVFWGGGRGVGWNLLRTGFTPSSEKQHSTQSLLKYIPCRWTIVTKIWQNFVRFYFIQVICTLNRKSHLFIKNYHKYNSVIWMIIVKIMFSLAKWTKRKRILWKAKHAVRRLSIKIKIVHFSRLARLTPPPHENGQAIGMTKVIRRICAWRNYDHAQRTWWEEPIVERKQMHVFLFYETVMIMWKTLRYLIYLWSLWRGLDVLILS